MAAGVRDKRGKKPNSVVYGLASEALHDVHYCCGCGCRTVGLPKYIRHCLRECPKPIVLKDEDTLFITTVMEKKASFDDHSTGTKDQPSVHVKIPKKESTVIARGSVFRQQTVKRFNKKPGERKVLQEEGGNSETDVDDDKGRPTSKQVIDKLGVKKRQQGRGAKYECKSKHLERDADAQPGGTGGVSTTRNVTHQDVAGTKKPVRSLCSGNGALKQELNIKAEKDGKKPAQKKLIKLQECSVVLTKMVLSQKGGGISAPSNKLQTGYRARKAGNLEELTPGGRKKARLSESVRSVPVKNVHNSAGKLGRNKRSQLHRNATQTEKRAARRLTSLARKSKALKQVGDTITGKKRDDMYPKRKRDCDSDSDGQTADIVSCKKLIDGSNLLQASEDADGLKFDVSKDDGGGQQPCASGVRCVNTSQISTDCAESTLLKTSANEAQELPSEASELPTSTNSQACNVPFLDGTKQLQDWRSEDLITI